MKKNLRVGVVVVGIAAVLYVGLSIGAAMKGVSLMELVELGSGVVAAKVSRHTTADRVAAIEDVFYLANAVGIRNVSVIIAPYDMRKGRKPELEKSPLLWYPVLCGEIAGALR